jgi:hypothetical protein
VVQSKTVERRSEEEPTYPVLVSSDLSAFDLDGAAVDPAAAVTLQVGPRSFLLDLRGGDCWTS